MLAIHDRQARRPSSPRGWRRANLDHLAEFVLRRAERQDGKPVQALDDGGLLGRRDGVLGQQVEDRLRRARSARRNRSTTTCRSPDRSRRPSARPEAAASLCSVETARILMSLLSVCCISSDALPKYISTSPATRPAIAGAPLLYGTATMSRPARGENSAVLRWMLPPTPAVA